MSILFIVLGLGCLAGGAYAIVEGWPYILIERGFTLVIVGTVLMTAGVVMLALSRVMAELRRVRGQLSSAVMALSVASMATSRDERESGPGVSFPPPDAAGEGGLRAGPAVLGGALAAGGVLAAGAVAVASREAPEAQDAPAANDTTAPGATGDTARDDEPDLFDASHETDTPVVGTAGPFMPPLWPEAETDAARETQAGSGTEPLPVATPDEFEAALAEATGAAEPGPAADKPFWMPETGPASAIDEDFDRLRDRLALGGDSKAKDDPVWDDLAAPTLAGERRDTSESEIGAAADWMTAIRPGQDRWFGASPAAESEPESVTEPGPAVEPPVWPPQTREAAPFVSEDVQISDEVQADEIVASAEAETHELATAEPPLPDLEAVREPEPLPTLALPPEPEPEFPAGPDMPPAPEGFAGLEPDAEPEAAPEFVASPAPAASEEGVVGAYQVGTAHFTIYADGSIQARTPEGDYSFASMDELKTYLASEKNRLEA